MTPAEYQLKLQQLHRRLQTAALAGAPHLGVFTHDYGLIWLELPAGNDEQIAQISNWRRYLAEERWLFAIDPFYLPLTGDDWAGIPRLERVDNNVRELPEVIVPGIQGGLLLLCRDQQATVDRLLAAEEQARITVLTRMTAVSRTVPAPPDTAVEGCWNCDNGLLQSCLGSDCVNFEDRKQTGASDR